MFKTGASMSATIESFRSPKRSLHTQRYLYLGVFIVLGTGVSVIYERELDVGYLKHVLAVYIWCHRVQDGFQSTLREHRGMLEVAGVGHTWYKRSDPNG